MFYGRRLAARSDAVPSREPMSHEALGSDPAVRSTRNQDVYAFVDASGSLWTKQPSTGSAPWLTAVRIRKSAAAMAGTAPQSEMTIASNLIKRSQASPAPLPDCGSATVRFASVLIPLVVLGEVADLMIREGSYPMMTVSLFALGITGLAYILRRCAQRSGRRPPS
jgi:hypothetical protein